MLVITRLKNLMKCLTNAKVGPELIESLGKGSKILLLCIKMVNLADAAVATNELCDKMVKTAAKTLGRHGMLSYS